MLCFVDKASFPSGRRPFPVLNAAFFGGENRVCPRLLHALDFFQMRFVSFCKLPFKVRKFIGKLSAADRDFYLSPCPDYLVFAKPVAPALSLTFDFYKIGAYRAQPVLVRFKPLQLRMVPVALCLACQHFLRKQCLPPKRDQPLGIKVFGMQRPKPHGK